MTLLRVTDLAVFNPVNKQAIVDHVSLHADPHDIVCVVGESGAGKSILAGAIMGQVPRGLVCTGTVALGRETWLAQSDPTGAARRHLWGRQVSLLPQEPWRALDPTMRVGTQIADVLRWVAHDRQPIESAHTALQASGVGAAYQQYPHMLSGGMAQRVAFTAATVGGATVLLADEPTKGLDLALVTTIAERLKALARGGGAVIVITHDIHLVRLLGGRLMVMQNGRVVESGETQPVLAAPLHPFTQAWLAADPAAWSVWPARPAGKSVVEAHNVNVHYARHRVVRNQSLTIGRGEWVGLTGPSGCGKTTFGKALLDLVPLTSGKVTRQVTHPHACQMLYQDPGAAFPPALTLGKHLRDVAIRHARLTALDAACERAHVDLAWLARLPHTLSGGELQRLALARLLLLSPEFVVADEPTSRLDPILQKLVLTTLHQALPQTAVLLISHDAGLLRATTSRQIDGEPTPTTAESDAHTSR
jgi:ABC-type glutathione transport system ATPase component